MQVVYRANDGTEFNLKDECQHYELQCNKTRTKDKYINYPELHGAINDKWLKSEELTAAFIISSIEELNTLITGALKQMDKPEEFIAGQTILVRDNVTEEWVDSVFIRNGDNCDFPFVCEHFEYGAWEYEEWKYAKSLSN
jgi:hypothetical protein